MEFIKTKRGALLIASTATALLVGGGVAFAYWTTTGTGSGEVATGTNANITIAQTNTVDGLYPGGSAKAINIKINNPDANAEKVGTVVVAVSGTNKQGCTASDFEVTNGTINALVSNGDNYYAGTDTGASIRMLQDTFNNQDACKNATVNLSFTVS